MFNFWGDRSLLSKLLLTDSQLWLDASDTSTITESSGSVSQWSDKSGNARNATQGTGAAQPAFTENIINNLPIIRFDGVDDTLTATIGAYASATVLFVGVSRVDPLPTSNTQAFMATAPSGVTPTGWSCTGKPFSGTTERRIRAEGNYTVQIYKNNVAGNSGFNPGAVGDIALGEAFVATYELTSGTAKTDLRIGALQNNSSHGQHDFGEILIFDRILSTNERTVMNAYLMNKWGI